MAPAWEAGADLVVVGTGVAGLTAALTARELGLRVLVVTKAGLGEGNTPWAQGGVAVVLPEEHEPGDTVARHAADTLAAGAGLCDERAVAVILAQGPGAVQRLREQGARFDTARDGALARTREGGHSAFRVIHAGGDATGAEVERALVNAVRDDPIPVLEQHIAVEALRTPVGDVAGLLVLDAEGAPGVVRAPAVLLATGGIGQLYQATTNPELATGDGLALALRAGAVLADVEFVQFHPTVLFSGPHVTGRRPLVTEAVRGEGAVLVDHSGARVMADVHPLADLAPRDVVAAAITRRMVATGQDHVLLDATHMGGDAFRRRFPTVHAACQDVGVDPAHEPIPVAPAAHFSCGGVMTTVDGRSGVTGLYAAGEVARTGLHGANRLASNSLLEGLVTGARAARAVAADLAAGLLADPKLAEPARPPAAPVVDRDALQRAMSRYAAIGRDASGLIEAMSVLDTRSVHRPLETHRAVEDAALAMVASTLLTTALQRTESRGCHVRTDHPNTDESWHRSLPVRLDAAGRLVHVEPVILGGVA
ncbi:L-aspartate oxidase [Longimycelium tulufanense]|uniref:L-aspartate oxidase n=1 Tax=Longimycelium tulufanense TaxID=907463 RepID=A0A8J3C9Z0_9PSEU|nr:L-aspartate oxidase [Longimycelium tulufanense]GGM37589.1 L-aspartate oxidase [Longimycelium tulufanense]